MGWTDRRTGTDERGHTPLAVVCGVDDAQVDAVAASMATDDTTVVVAHDLGLMSEGVVRRRLTHRGRVEEKVLELAHGCVTCTLRGDLLPLVRRLARRRDVERIVVRLDVRLEPEQLCWALEAVELGGRPVADDVRVAGVVAVLDAEAWLSDVTSDELVADRGLAAAPEDDRTVAQLLVGHAEFADVIAWTGAPDDAWSAERTTAVTERLNATAIRTTPHHKDWWELLAHLPASARRGELDDPHGPLLRGEPPLARDDGIELVLFSDRRPFHPQRLAAALDALPFGIVRLRGRLWVASQPETILWIDAAGPSVRLADAGLWLAAQDERAWAHLPSERAALASLRWHDTYGDRSCDLVALVDGAEAEEITDVLAVALLTDDEIAQGDAAWRAYPDPFAEEPDHAPATRGQDHPRPPSPGEPT